MIKFLAKLIGWREQRSGSDRFHQQEQIESELAKERQAEAKEREKERLRNQMEKREIPSESDILGPSSSAEREEA